MKKIILGIALSLIAFSAQADTTGATFTSYKGGVLVKVKISAPNPNFHPTSVAQLPNITLESATKQLTFGTLVLVKGSYQDGTYQYFFKFAKGSQYGNYQLVVGIDGAQEFTDFFYTYKKTAK